nr:immunoglobulin light chain junction region [Macaca mulatta]MOX69368.1 immunoglobulin light chain junction region [Macaca mulatta]MOX72133.1 immunoglobulin light chain junction region [Macaca mulatta]MOX72460.1 immunoglobulin light chain junction region [Macaca mulatta]MOX72971.1 immunoglobulin light chain junction region [Macaca mulatta]
DYYCQVWDSSSGSDHWVF